MLDRVRAHAIEIALFALALWPALYWNNGASIPQISRLDAVYAFVEPGTPDTGSFRIDRFVRVGRRSANTIDWARNPAQGPETYSNKAPGLQIAAVPVYAALFHGSRGLGGRPTWPGPTYVLAWLLNVLVQGPIGALLAPVFYRLSRDAVGLAPPMAAGLSLVLWFGTGLAPFHSQIWGHTAAATLVALPLLAAWRAAPAWAGLFAGLGVLADYSLAIPLLTLASWIGWRQGLRGLARFALGGAGPFAAYAAYHWACFGNPFAPALLYNNPRFIDGQAAGGILGPRRLAEALWGLSFSSFRGIFFFWPVCAVVFPALALAPRLRREPLFALSLANVLLFFFANAAFNGWHGGSTLGPRYQIPVLPCYGLLGAFVVRELGGRWRDRPGLRRAAGALAACAVAVSVANAFVGLAISPLAPAEGHFDERLAGGIDWSNPLGHYYGLLLRGELQPHPLLGIRSVAEPEEAVRLRTWNAGEWLGLGSGASVALYGAVALAGCAWTLRRAADSSRLATSR